MSRPEDDMKPGMVSVCYLRQLIWRQVGELGLTAEKIAESMSRYLGKPVSTSSVGHYKDGTNTGIPEEKIGAYLDAHDLKGVPKKNICIPPDRWYATVTLANERLAQLAEEAKR